MAECVPRGPGAAYTFSCQKCYTRFDRDRVSACPQCGGWVLTVVRGRIPHELDPPRTDPPPARRTYRVPVARRSIVAKMIKKGPSTAASADGPTNTTKKPKLAAVPPKAAAPVKSVKPKVEKAPPVRKFVGATTGLGVRDFQNQLMKNNFKAKWTDLQLATAMRQEFPSAVPYTEKHVKGIRGGWNKGKHGNEVPAKPLPEFDIDGNVVEGRKRQPRVVKPPVAAPPKPARIVAKRATATA